MPVMLKRVLPFSIALLIGVTLGSLTNPVETHRSAVAHVSPEQQTNHSRTWVVIRSLPTTIYTGTYTLGERLPISRLRVLLDADGTVSEIEPLLMKSECSPEEVINAARNIKFTPATRDGKPISVWVEMEYQVRWGRSSREFRLSPTIIDASSEAGEPWRVIHE
jgi:hypothetical protein